MIAMNDVHSTADDAATEAPIGGFGLALSRPIAGLVTVVFASFGPWLRSGQRSRTSYTSCSKSPTGSTCSETGRCVGRPASGCSCLSSPPSPCPLRRRHLEGGCRCRRRCRRILPDRRLGAAGRALTAEWGSRIGVAGGLAAVTSLGATATHRPVQATDQRGGPPRGLRWPGNAMKGFTDVGAEAIP